MANLYEPKSHRIQIEIGLAPVILGGPNRTRRSKGEDVTLIYDTIGAVDPTWFLVVGVILLGLDIFLFNTAILLLFSVSMFLISALSYYGFDSKLITWAIPVSLLFSAALHRPLLGALYKDKLPYEEKRSGAFMGEVFGGENENMSSDFFYDFKDEKQITFNNDNSSTAPLRIRLDDGRVFPLPESHKNLGVGVRVKVRLAENERLTLEKIYE